MVTGWSWSGSARGTNTITFPVPSSAKYLSPVRLGKHHDPELSKVQREPGPHLSVAEPVSRRCSRQRLSGAPVVFPKRKPPGQPVLGYMIDHQESLFISVGGPDSVGPGGAHSGPGLLRGPAARAGARHRRPGVVLRGKGAGAFADPLAGTPSGGLGSAGARPGLHPGAVKDIAGSRRRSNGRRSSRGMRSVMWRMSWAESPARTITGHSS